MGRGFEGLDGHNGYAALASTTSLVNYGHGGPTDHGELIEMKYEGGEELRARASEDEILFRISTYVACKCFGQRGMRGYQ